MSMKKLLAKFIEAGDKSRQRNIRAEHADMWHVRFINADGVYHPYHKGFLVHIRANYIRNLGQSTGQQAVDCIKAHMNLDTGPGGEYEGWELSPEIVEFTGGTHLVQIADLG